MDASEERPLAASYPLPFRVLFLVGLGILGWATNLHGLELLGIDGPGVLELKQSHGYISIASSSHHRRKPSARAFYAPVYRLFAMYSCWCFVTWLLYSMLTQSHVALADVFRYIPGVSLLGVLAILFCTFDIAQKRERDSFLLAAERCLFAASRAPIHFSDIIYADVLTSYAKVLGDLWLSLWMLVPGGSILSIPSQEGWYRWILPSLMSLPYVIRLRQCLTEYRSPTNTSRRPLFNAIKYASSFPVIFLSAAQRIVVSELVQIRGDSVRREAWHGEHPLFRLWLLAAIANSLYSFWWDLTNDWGLDLLQLGPTPRVSWPPILGSVHPDTPPANGSLSRQPISSTFTLTGRSGRTHHYGLRPILLYPLSVYPLIVFFNLVLRMTWSIKLSSHLHLQSEGSRVIFWLEVAEVLRRWMWVFLRVEWEVVKRGSGVEQNTDPADAIPLFDVAAERRNVD